MASPATVFQRFESRTNLERTAPQLRLYRLERMHHLLHRLGDPQNDLPVVHIAGSKGKGSTAAYTSSLLAAAGYRVGLYTSPHVTDYRERFAVIPPGQVVSGGPEAPPDDRIDPEGQVLAEAGMRVWSVVEDLAREGTPEDDLPTTFELLTALAFCYFPEIGCDWIVLETGLGGRLDATNVCTPALTLITRIEIEHTEYLGSTRREIAREKAGIIKPGVPLLLAPQHPEADSVFREVAGDRRAPLVDVLPLAADRSAPHRETGDRSGATPPSLSGPTVRLPSWAGGAQVRAGMLGAVQQTNIAMALTAVRRLSRQGRITAPSAEAIHRALSGTRLPGRGEVLRGVILDGAHTPESAAALAASLRAQLPTGGRLVIILGIVAGKNVEAIADALAPLTDRFIVSRPGRFKPGDPADVARRIGARGYAVVRHDDPGEALATARAHLADAGSRPGNAAILVSGSFYMVAEIRRLLLQ